MLQDAQDAREAPTEPLVSVEAVKWMRMHRAQPLLPSPTCGIPAGSHTAVASTCGRRAPDVAQPRLVRGAAVPLVAFLIQAKPQPL